MFRNEFELNGEILSARAYVTSHGVYEMEINGEKVGSQEFAPGWTSYHNRLQYQTYDITDLLENGENAIGTMLGDGWYRGYLAWGDASVIVPWAIYQAYGDEQILETQYESMEGWVDFMKNRAVMDSTTYLRDNNLTFGDWLSFNSTASDYPGAYTDKALISTAFFAHSTDLMARSARVLGKDGEAEEYEALFENIKEAFQHEYMTSSGRIMSNTQTAYLLALQFDLLSEEMEFKAAEYLISRINERGHLTTGFLGTPHLNPILSQFGYSDQAYELLLRKDYPS